MTRGVLGAVKEPIEDRFNRKYVVLDNGCWEWTAAINNMGYGTFGQAPGVKVYAHRWAYQHFIGPIPEGTVLDHVCHTTDPHCDDGLLCRHRRCCNPHHLEPVSAAENTWRSKAATKTHCVNGHEFTPENTWYRPDRRARCCRACAAARQRKRNSSIA